MAILLDPPITLSFEMSKAIDLFWSLSKPCRKDADTRPALDAGLIERASSFWSDRSSCFTELILLAHHAGVLSGDVATPLLLDGIRAACTSVPLQPRLATETPEEREIIWSRLAVLRNDADRRGGYLALLDEVWAASEEAWRRQLPHIMAVLRECEERSRRNQSWKDVFGKNKALDKCVEAAFERSDTAGEQIVIAACAFGGAVTLDLENLQLIGLSVAQAFTDPRARAGAPARRFRALADPTRLAVLEMVARSPSSVGTLASALGVSQPTVSNHVKLLVEAGLITSERSGKRPSLVLDEGGVDRLLAEAASILRPA